MLPASPILLKNICGKNIRSTLGCIHLSLESLTVLGLLAAGREDPAWGAGLGLPLFPPVGSSTSDLRAGSLSSQRGSKQGEGLDGERGHHKIIAQQSSAGEPRKSARNVGSLAFW